jgi:lipoprotein signal peptidase
VVYFAVFNVADSFICIGFAIIIVIVLKTFFKKEHPNIIDLKENNKIDAEKQ